MKIQYIIVLLFWVNVRTEPASAGIATHRRQLMNVTKRTKSEVLQQAIRLLLLGCFSAVAGHSGIVPIDISAVANTTWTTFPLLKNGALFPTGNQTYDN